MGLVEINAREYGVLDDFPRKEVFRNLLFLPIRISSQPNLKKGFEFDLPCQIGVGFRFGSS